MKLLLVSLSLFWMLAATCTGLIQFETTDHNNNHLETYEISNPGLYYIDDASITNAKNIIFHLAPSGLLFVIQFANDCSDTQFEIANEITPDVYPEGLNLLQEINIGSSALKKNGTFPMSAPWKAIRFEIRPVFISHGMPEEL